MKILVVLALITSVAIAVKVRSCGPKDSIIKIDKVSVVPHPLRLYQPVVVGGRAIVKKSIERGAVLKTQAWRVLFKSLFGGVETPLPCQNGAGSCEADFCNPEAETAVCDFLKKTGRAGSETHCGCPILPGTYEAYNIRINATEEEQPRDLVSAVTNLFTKVIKN